MCREPNPSLQRTRVPSSRFLRLCGSPLNSISLDRRHDGPASLDAFRTVRGGAASEDSRSRAPRRVAPHFRSWHRALAPIPRRALGIWHATARRFRRNPHASWVVAPVRSITHCIPLDQRLSSARPRCLLSRMVPSWSTPASQPSPRLQDSGRGPLARGRNPCVPTRRRGSPEITCGLTTRCSALGGCFAFVDTLS